MANSDDPHVLIFPFPAQGHVRPILKLAELLSIAGLRITFINTIFTHLQLLAASNATVARLAARPGFRFRTITDGLPDDQPRGFSRIGELVRSMAGPEPREEYKAVLTGEDGWPPVSCVVADGFSSLAVEVPIEVGVPMVVVRTSSASGILAYHCATDLINNGEILFSGADLDETVRSVPGMESFLRRRDLPSFIRNAKSMDDYMLQIIIKSSVNSTRGRAIILNSLETFEGIALSHLPSRGFPIAFPIGPFHALLRELDSSTENDNRVSNSGSFWEDDSSCLSWLDSQSQKSVIYVSFGSLTVISKEKLLEIWHGLANCGYPFLWVMRKGLLENQNGTAEQETPAELIEVTRKRGCIIEWAPQEEVLAHKSIGCFLTHSRWNSTLESIVAAVPMICWPLFAKQLVNSRFVSEVWKIGVDMKDMNDRNIVKKMIKEVMEGEKAAEIRSSVEKMSVIARESVKEGGSSYENLQRLVQEIKAISSEYYTTIKQASVEVV